MATRVTVRDVAKKLNVSHTTVSRVLSQRDNVFISEATRQRVLDAAQKMGYRPNPVARALATGRTHSIMFWTKTVFASYVAGIVHHTQQAVQQDGFLLNIWDMEPFADESQAGRYGFPQTPADGILALEDPEFVAGYRGAQPIHHMPIVSMGGNALRQGDYVGLDLSIGTVEAVRHLLEIGCRRIAYLVPSRGVMAGDPRYDSYHQVMRNVGRPPEVIVASDGLRASAHRTLGEHVARQGHPDGLFCYNDDMAIGANRALREMGLRVPDDVALVGCDGIEETEYQQPQLSTITLPLQEMSRTAWRFLQARMEDPQLPDQQAELKTSLVIRGSSKRS